MSSNKKVIVCPLPFHPHQHQTPSFSIFQGRDGQEWKCHGACGKQGDVIDLVGYMKIPGYNDKDPDHIRRALSILNGGYKISPIQIEKPNPFGLPNDLWKQYQTSETVYQYAATRGLLRETVDFFRLGEKQTEHSRWMTMPSFDRERLMGIKMRNMDPGAAHRHRFINEKGSVGSLFNLNSIRDITEPVLVVKSEIPCMLLHQYGIKVCAPTVSENIWADAGTWYVQLSLSPKRILVADNDPSEDVRAKIMKYAKLRADLLHAELRTPPEQFKDIDDWVRAEPDTAIPTIKEWMK